MHMSTIITGHSGFENTGRDSLYSVEAAVERKLDCVEVDVRIDAMGALRLSHDARKDYGAAATLAQAMDIIASSGTCINCDLKSPFALYPVLELAGRCGLKAGQLIFSGSVSCDLLAYDADVAHRARIFLNIEELVKYFLCASSGDMAGLLRDPWPHIGSALDSAEPDLLRRIADAARALGAEAINLPHRLPLSVLRSLRACGAELSIWTVNDEADIVRALSLEPINITTMEPERVARVINRP